jgi:hypothetical protein
LQRALCPDPLHQIEILFFIMLSLVHACYWLSYLTQTLVKVRDQRWLLSQSNIADIGRPENK